MINIFSVMIHTLLPRYCYGCEDVLVEAEEVICLDCLLELNKTHNLHETESELTKKVSFSFNVENAVSFIYFDSDSIARKLIHRFKYEEDIIIGKYLTRLFCQDLKQKDWIKDIDYIIPLPLHWLKKVKRGYNQSEIISNIIGKEFDIRVKTNYLKRIKYTQSQTKKSREKRWDNVKGIFRVINQDKLKNKHILLVDDIVTTGSSIYSCINELSKIEGIKISVLTLASTN